MTSNPTTRSARLCLPRLRLARHEARSARQPGARQQPVAAASGEAASERQEEAALVTQAAGSGADDGAELLEITDLLKSRIRDVVDYPQPGIVFKDITPLLADGAAFAAVVAALAAGHEGVTKVAGIEARGFILAAPVALALRAGFVPVRKQGKLPGADLRGVLRARVRHRHARGAYRRI